MRRRRRRFSAWALALVLGACASRDASLPPGAGDGGAPTEDGGAARPDGGARPDDGGRTDGGAPDAGAQDGGLEDGGVVDAGSEDGGPDAGPDGGRRDGGVPLPDAGPGVPCETGGATVEREPNDRPIEAVRIAPGTAVRGRIVPPPDEDWYLLDVCAESLVVADLRLTGAPTARGDGGVQPGGSFVDLRLDVLAADGTTLLNWQQDRRGEDGPTRMHLVAYAERAGPIYLRITDVGGDEMEENFDYELTVATAPVPDADVEPNGNKGPVQSAELALPLAENTLATQYLAFSRDEDWYRLTIPGLRIVDLTVTDAPATGTPLAYRLRLLGPDGVTELGRAQTAAPGPGQSAQVRLSAQVPAAGDYFAVVSDQSDQSDATRPYRIFYRLRAVPDAEIEPNEGPAQATPLAPGTGRQAFVSVAADEDWYAVTVGDTKILRARLTVSPGLRTPVDYRVTVLGPDGATRLAEATDFDGQFGDIEVVAHALAPAHASPYFVQVTDWRKDDGDTTVPYVLTATLLDVPDAALEPNDTPATARAAPLGQPVTAYIAWQFDRDHFHVDAQDGQTITAALTAPLTPVQYRLAILAPNGSTRLADAYDVDGRALPNDLTVAHRVAPAPDGGPSGAGRYFVVVEDLGLDDVDLVAPYTLTVTLTGP